MANYYTPNGNSINKTGIEPDVEVELDASLVNETEISHDEDNQLQAALKVLNDKNVSGADDAGYDKIKSNNATRV